MKKFFKYTCLLGLILMILGCVAVVFIFIFYSIGLPKYSQLKNYNPELTTRVYSSNGKILREYAKENRIFVGIEDIPDVVKHAFLSAEDSNFYHHSGIDFRSIASAMLDNVKVMVSGHGSIRGGSTITQQVAKNFLLTSDKTLKRKIKEAILARRITRTLSKDKVLELYLNQIYLGNRSYGVASAALNYFNKPLEEITIEEAALLSAMPKAPGKLNPHKNYSGALERRNWVLSRMKTEGYITKKQYEEAVKTPITLVKRSENETFNAGAFTEEVRKSLLAMYDEATLMTDGLVITTTLDPSMQSILDKYFKNGIETYDRRHGYRGALGNVYRDSVDLEKNWLSYLKTFDFDKEYRKDWEMAVVLDLDEVNNRAIIGLEYEDKKMSNPINQLSKCTLELTDEAGEITKTEENCLQSYIGLENLMWAVPENKLFTRDEETGELANSTFKVEKISDTLLKKGDIILVGSSPNKFGYDLKQIPNVNGGAVIMDPHTGRVLAMIGGYFDSEITFNRATQANRQLGSIVKPFVYLAALENGFTPATIIMDEEISLYQGDDKPPYVPKNDSNQFYGPNTLRMALQRSRNLSTVRLASEMGLDKVVKVIRRFGVNKRPRPIYSLVLGSLESHLINVTTAYAMIVNGGKEVKPALIEKIQDKHGETIFKRDSRECVNCLVDEKTPLEDTVIPVLEDNRKTVTDPATAYQITSILEGVVKYGTGWRAKSINKIVGGKTGTSNDSRDAWFMGFTPDIVMGVFVGFDDNRSLGLNEGGSFTASPIFVNTMKEVLKNKPSIPFRVPQDIKLVRIDMDTGRLPDLNSKPNRVIFEAFKQEDNITDDPRILNKKQWNNGDENTVILNPESQTNDELGDFSDLIY